MKRFIAMLLVLTMLPTLCAWAFAAEPEAREITEQDYAMVDAMWQTLNRVETTELAKRSTHTASDKPITHSTAKAVAAAVEASELYVEGSIRWNGADFFSFETTTGVRCCYSTHLRNRARAAKPDTAAQTAPNFQTISYGTRSTTGSTSVYLIEPYYGLDKSFTLQYQSEAKKMAEHLGGTYVYYKTTEATIDKVAEAVEQGGIVIFDSHGDTDYANGDDYVTGATSSYLCLQTGEGLTEADYADDNGTSHAYYGGSYNKMRYYLVDGTCIANHMKGRAQNSLLWSAICLSMATDGLHAPLREKGVGVAYGYSQSVSFDYDYYWEAEFFYSMREGATVAQAIASMKQRVGLWDYCEEYETIQDARENYCAFPIVVSDEDSYPGHGKVDVLQNVRSTWVLPTGDDPQPVYTLTAESSDETLGTVTQSDLRVIAAPAEGAYVAGWTLTPEDAATVTQEGNVFTVSDLKADCRLRVIFAAKTPAVVHYSVPEGTQKADSTGYIGEAITLSAPDGTPTSNLPNCRFVGWTEEPVAESLDFPMCFAETYTPVKAETTLYALYSYETDGVTVYTTELQTKICYAARFTDVDLSLWYHEALDFVLEQNIMQGMDETTFSPNGSLTRAMLVTMLYRLSGDNAQYEHPFTDVPDGIWYQDAVAWAFANQVVNGMTETTFEPEQPVTREQTAVMLYRYAQRDSAAEQTGNLSEFLDANEISDYATSAMQWAVGAGVLRGRGDGHLDPLGTSTRAEIAQMFFNWITK